MDDMREKLRRFIAEEILLEEHSSVGDDMPLLESLDSLGLLTLVAYIEGQFDVEIPQGDLVPGNFSTPLAVEQLVRVHLAPAP
ncbi:MAG: acyl carrier protein [Actinobacteria bacterium]|nr:acyl carrier protein [Actinomycetota bacterium]